jgi:phosphoglycerate dehydrogenase-like enzyme
MSSTTLFRVATLLLATGFSAGAPAAESQDSPVRQLIENFGLEQAASPVSQRPGWRKPKRILVDPYFPQLIDTLRAAAPEVEFVAAERGQLARQATDVDAVIGLCTPEIVAAGNSIRWIGLLSAGVEQCVGIPQVRERDILVTNMQRIGGPIIAEHVMAMLLAFTRGLDVYIQAQARREWRRNMPAERATVIAGKTMLVVGLGGIGSEVAKRAHAMGMRVIATRASGREGPSFVSYVGLPAELPKLAAQADVIVNTAPLTPQTTGMFDAAFFAKMKQSAYFINIARGGSVVTSALVDALKNDRIAGAALDVTDPEPLPANHPLWQLSNVIITPHVSNDSDLGEGAKVTVIRENLRRYINGERMLSVVDTSKGY